RATGRHATITRGLERSWPFRGGTPARIKPKPLRICGQLRPNFLSRFGASQTAKSPCVTEMRMSHVTAKVASTLLIGVAAAAVSTAFPSRSANAADSCLTEPKGDTAGKHWYYHIERGTGRHCWYQRGQDDASARTDDDTQAASDEAPPSNTDPATARTFA